MEKSALGQAEDELLKRLKSNPDGGSVAESSINQAAAAVRALAISSLCSAVAGTLFYLQGVVGEAIAREARNG